MSTVNHWIFKLYIDPYIYVFKGWEFIFLQTTSTTEKDLLTDKDFKQTLNFLELLQENCTENENKYNCMGTYLKY